jgi:hypothetical protein
MRSFAVFVATLLVAGCLGTEPKAISSTVSVSQNTAPVGATVTVTVSIVNASDHDVLVEDIRKICGTMPFRIFDAMLNEAATPAWSGGVCDLGGVPSAILHPGDELSATFGWESLWTYDQPAGEYRSLPAGKYLLAPRVFAGGVKVGSNVVAFTVTQ